jgi:hypothetical protein
VNFFQSGFTTAQTPDTATPAVVAVGPQNGATGVPLNARISRYSSASR